MGERETGGFGRKFGRKSASEQTTDGAHHNAPLAVGERPQGDADLLATRAELADPFN